MQQLDGADKGVLAQHETAEETVEANSLLYFPLLGLSLLEKIKKQVSSIYNRATL